MPLAEYGFDPGMQWKQNTAVTIFDILPYHSHLIAASSSGILYFIVLWRDCFALKAKHAILSVGFICSLGAALDQSY